MDIKNGQTARSKALSHLVRHFCSTMPLTNAYPLHLTISHTHTHTYETILQGFGSGLQYGIGVRTLEKATAVDVLPTHEFQAQRSVEKRRHAELWGVVLPRERHPFDKTDFQCYEGI